MTPKREKIILMNSYQWRWCLRLFNTFLVLLLAVILSGCIALPVRYTGYYSYRVHDRPVSTTYHHGVVSTVPRTYGHHHASHHSHVTQTKVLHKKVVVLKPQKVIINKKIYKKKVYKKKKAYKKKAYKKKNYKKKSSKKRRVSKKSRRR